MINPIRYARQAILKHQMHKAIKRVARKESALGCNTQAVHKARNKQTERVHDALRAVVARDKSST